MHTSNERHTQTFIVTVGEYLAVSDVTYDEGDIITFALTNRREDALVFAEGHATQSIEKMRQLATYLGDTFDNDVEVYELVHVTAYRRADVG